MEGLLLETNLSGRSAVLRRVPVVPPKHEQQDPSTPAAGTSVGGGGGGGGGGGSKQVSIAPLSLYGESTAGVWGGRPAAAPGWVRLRLKKSFWRQSRVACLSCNDEFFATYHPRHEPLALEQLAEWRANSFCRRHGGIFSENRKQRDRGKKRCPGTCRAPHCSNGCARTPHSMRLSLDRIGCLCASKMCPHPCSQEGCKRMCCEADHWHGAHAIRCVYVCACACAYVCVCV